MTSRDGGSRTRQLLHLIGFLSSRPGATVEETSKAVDMPKKKVIDALNTILLCGVPPYYPDDYIGVSISDDKRIELRFADHFRGSLRLTPAEAMALKLLIHSLGPGRRESMEAPLRSLSEKVDRVLANLGALQPGEADRRVGGGDRAAKDLRKHVQRAEQAVHDRRVLRMEYHSLMGDELTERDVEPHAVVDDRGNLYLVGWCRLRDAERRFRMDRIRTLETTRATFDLRDEIDLDALADGPVYRPSGDAVTARVRVPPEQVRWAKEDEAVGKVRTFKDNGGEAVLKCEGLHFPMWWTLRHGPHAELVEPEEARAALREEAERALALYGGKSKKKSKSKSKKKSKSKAKSKKKSKSGGKKKKSSRKKTAGGSSKKTTRKASAARNKRGK